MEGISGTGLEGVVELHPAIVEDDRGYFSETYSKARLQDWGIHDRFVQDNHSWSKEAGVIRGLHYQLEPRAQAKLVRVITGRIFDVVVDIRRNSPTFGDWVGVELSQKRWNQLYVPIGFAHGFMTLEPDVHVAYTVSDYYAPEYERSIRFDDPQIAIEWPEIYAPRLSDKDRNAPLLADSDVF